MNTLSPVEIEAQERYPFYGASKIDDTYAEWNRKHFIEGANWQKERDKSRIEERDEYRKALHTIAYGFFPQSHLIAETALNKYNTNK